MSVSSSAFDPAAFEAVSTNESSSTSITPIPAGEYNATIEDYKFRSGVSRKSNETFVSMDIIYRIIDDSGAIAAEIGREPKLTQSYFVDTNASGGFDFAKGKNVWLGKLREALGMNVPGQQFSFGMLKGQACRITVIQDPAKDSDDVYNRVKAVGRIA